MTFPEFDKFFDDFIDECRKMRDSKGIEYANSENRFDNFNRISVQIGISNQQVGMVYLTKHLDSIQSYLKTGKIHSTERIRGRYIDAVTYLILMAGMAEEGSPTTPIPSSITMRCNSESSDKYYCCSLLSGHTGVHRAYRYHDISTTLLHNWA